MKKNSAVVILCFVSLIIGGCARNIDSNTYDARTVGSAASTYHCTVISVRKVKVEEGDRLEDNGTGAIIGALTGGALGNAVGGGRGRTVATVAGAVAGATAGAYAEKSLKSQYGFEYVVELRSGQLKTVVQGSDVILAPGQSALLVVDYPGRSRLIPR
ncbi:MAG: glycine zipper 2TM domain-containing protein [Holosporaceae bacterium]|jgi:outer membrane lipoprotein SlyB|nr:glycine zipper 2TM domain-containing protein [Holosporaceae bacterium]